MFKKKINFVHRDATGKNALNSRNVSVHHVAQKLDFVGTVADSRKQTIIVPAVMLFTPHKTVDGWLSLIEVINIQSSLARGSFYSFVLNYCKKQIVVSPFDYILFICFIHPWIVLALLTIIINFHPRNVCFTCI